MKRIMEITDNKFEIVQSYMKHMKFAIQYNRLSYFPDFRAACHWHDDIEMAIILQGRMNYYVNGKIVFLDEGESIIVNSKQMHYGYAYNDENCYFISSLIHPDIFNIGSSIYSEYVEPFIYSYNEYIKLNKKDTMKIKKILEKINKFKYKQDGELLCMGHMYLLWAVLKKFADINKSMSLSANFEDIAIQKRMVEFIYKNYSEDISLSDIAKQVNICISKCCKLFKKYTGNTPMGFLLVYRLEKSKMMLSKEDIAISEISERCGFNSHAYFSKMFLKRYGISPLCYKKRVLCQIKLMNNF